MSIATDIFRNVLDLSDEVTFAIAEMETGKYSFTQFCNELQKHGVIVRTIWEKDHKLNLRLESIEGGATKQIDIETEFLLF